MSEINKQTCSACGSKGWLWCNAEGDHPPREEVQRCHACLEFANDQAVLEAVVKAAESQPALLKFVEEGALLKHEGEPSDDGKPFEPTSEDAIATFNQLILEARQLLGTADRCDKCKETVPYVIGCPDGTELCQDCFDAGQNQSTKTPGGGLSARYPCFRATIAAVSKSTVSSEGLKSPSSIKSATTLKVFN